MKTLPLIAASFAAALAFAAPASAQLASTGDGGYGGYGHFYGQFQSGKRVDASRTDTAQELDRDRRPSIVVWRPTRLR
ncbi:hypothetical protein VQ042_01445 [Aurantimonas sp. A2-1-M11]|uniref:hypothetical protein n=1 Tax=Aurantimonas sp. A2-1-M11 TaxID=3113712 RepID=UPI002F938074